MWKGSISAVFDKIFEIENIRPETLLKEPHIDDRDVKMTDENEAEDVEMEGEKVSRITNNCHSDGQANEIAGLDSSLLGESKIKSLCNEILLALLLKGDQRAIGSSATGTDCDMDGPSNRTVSDELVETEKVCIVCIGILVVMLVSNSNSLCLFSNSKS